MKGRQVRRSARTVAGLTVALILALALSGALRVAAQQPRRGASVSKHHASPRHRFTRGRAAPRIPFESVHNIVFVQTRVNNSKPLWFVLDTGASASIINARVAKELGLRAARTERSTGTGGEVEAGMIDGVTLSLPGVEVFNQTVGSLPLDDLAPTAGRAIGGILGYDFIKEFVVEIDYDAKLLNLYEPAGYVYKGTGEVVPVSFSGNKPTAKAALVLSGDAPFEGTFEIDTGSDELMLVNSPFVKAHRLNELVSNFRLGNSGGVGGMVRSQTGRVAGVRLGRFTFDRPLVTLSQANAGSAATAAYDGELGGELFRRFKMILDYSRRRIILEPNAHLREPVETDMSGLEFAGESDDFERYVVNEVSEHSPAAEAGVKEEDVLTAVDGRPASSLTLEEVRALLRREGEERVLTVRRGDKTLSFRIKLRRLL